MTTDPRRLLSRLALLLVLTTVAFPVGAQETEGDEEETGFGEIFAEIGVWGAQPTGLEYHAATEADPGNPFNTMLLNPAHGTESAFRYRGGFEFARNVGAVIFTWYAQEETTAESRFRPGEFVFGELTAHPLFAGYADNGLADGFSQTTDTLLRDFRGDFYRTAFRSGRVEARWFAGYRRIHFQRRHGVEYYGLVPDFPAFVPPLTEPRPDLDPLPDETFTESWYIGRGVEAGMDFVAPLWRDRVSLEAGFAGAALRGKTTTQYRSTTHAYLLDGFVVGQDLYLFDFFVDDIVQADYEIGLKDKSRPQSGSIIEAYFGFRARLTKNLELFGGFRNAHYEGVGLDLKPKEIVVTPASVNVQDVTETVRSATYEGLYGGVAVRF